METFANNAVGNLNASILIGATSLVLQAGQGALFPATGNFRIVIGTEIIIVGARSGDTLSSLTRGAESTAAAAHNSADVVTHELTAGSLGALAQSNWIAYTPAWTSSGVAPVLNNGTITGSYTQIGKTVTGYLNLTMGSTTTFGTGAYVFSLPVATGDPQSVLGQAYIVDASAAQAYVYATVLASGTTVQLGSLAAPTVFASNVAPVTFAVSDSIIARFTYQIP